MARLPGNIVLRRQRLRPERIRMPRPRRFHYRPAPAHVLLAFAAAIGLGTLLLALPPASQTREWTSPLDTVFTATSAVCVTGLTRVDTADYWSGFGEAVILALVQLGGLGIMASAAFLFLLIGRGMSAGAWLGFAGTPRAAGLPALGGTLRRLLLYVALVEGVAIVALLPWFIDRDGADGAWRAVFHGVSAFNNAGFDVMGGGRSLLDLQDDPYPLAVLAGAAFLGSLSFFVAADLVRRPRSWSTETRLVLVGTAALLLFGVLLFALAEDGRGTLGGVSAPVRWLNALVMSVMGRTTGFSTVDLSAVDDGTAAGGVGLMLIGGVAGSTAGGVKVGTAMVLAAAVWSGLRGRGQAEAFGREIPQATVVRAMTIVLVFVGAVAVGTWLLALTDDAPFLSTLFTVASALGTVGWSRGVEPELETAGALIVTGLMFFGRLAPLVLATAVSHGGPARFRYPPASIRVG